jgi:hypothetical protein
MGGWKRSRRDVDLLVLFAAQRAKPSLPQGVSDFMQALSWPGPSAKNLYGVTAALLGILLWCWAALDWAGYSGFVLSLRWF